LSELIVFQPKVEAVLTAGATSPPVIRDKNRMR